ncbi:tetratricopeptide repeat protein [Aliivibrio finisterrensis]|uniref:tetratricopeptide repeat protein n=1 Tax=Aliivibrio finisterrensis TaxID=511998 RepID=UPI001FCBC3E3|nr:tetratricopeptide repeat protein [Aliivibrio finisterrensis]
MQEAWNVGFQALESTPQDSYLKGALFWVCYEFLKQQQEKISKRASSSGNFRPSDYEFEQIENLLQTVMNLEIETGGLEYKMLLVQFRKNLEWFPTLVHCVLRHQGALFDHETMQPFQAEKGEVPSLMLSSTRQIVAAWLRAKTQWQIEFESVIALINLTKSSVTDTKHLIWLDYDYAKCLIVTGQLEQARALILPILRKKQKESWAWGALAATYRSENPEFAIKFFAKGIVSAHEITFSLRLLNGIVPLLVEKQRFAEASMCVKTALSVYQSNGWKVKPDLERLSQNQWYAATVDQSQLNTYLSSISLDASDFLNGPVTKVKALVENIHKSEKGFHTFVNKSTSYSVRMGVHKAKGRPEVGSYVELSLSQKEGEFEVVASKPCQDGNIDDVSYIEGELRIAPKGFGFVEDTFIPPFVIDETPSGSQVKALRVMTWDKVKSRYSWKAIKLTIL